MYISRFGSMQSLPVTQAVNKPATLFGAAGGENIDLTSEEKAALKKIGDLTSKDGYLYTSKSIGRNNVTKALQRLTTTNADKILNRLESSGLIGFPGTNVQLTEKGADYIEKNLLG